MEKFHSQDRIEDHINYFFVPSPIRFIINNYYVQEEAAAVKSVAQQFFYDIHKSQCIEWVGLTLSIDDLKGFQSKVHLLIRDSIEPLTPTAFNYEDSFEVLSNILFEKLPLNLEVLDADTISPVEAANTLETYCNDPENETSLLWHETINLRDPH